MGGGLVLGLAGALSVGRVMGTLLWGMEPTDPVTLFAVMAVPALTGLLWRAICRRGRRADGIRLRVLRDD